MSTGATVRMNISLTKDLKDRMEQVEASVNWSAVAVEGFERKLLELASRKETTSMAEVNERLKAADELDGKESYQEGLQSGRIWASDTARPKQLRTLEKFAYSPKGIRGSLERSASSHNAGIACGLYRDINPRAEGDRSSVESFWEDALGEKWEALIEDADFATGFCEGALEVWNKASY